MTRFVSVEELFKGRHFEQEIVVLCVRWYLSYKLSYRDLVAMMGEVASSWRTRPFCGGYSTALHSRIPETLEPIRSYGGRVVANG